jgi:RNA polymerase-binding protein DksA
VSSVDDGEFRRRLLDERERVAAAIEFLQRENPGSMEDEVEELPLTNHPAGTATVTFDRELDYSLEESEVRHLEAIDAALGRLDAGTFGLCSGCRRPIPQERLAARPYATLCIACKQREERG